MRDTDSRRGPSAAIAALPFAGVAVGALAQKTIHRGLELGIFELLGVALLGLVLDRAVRPRLGLATSSLRAPVSIGVAALGLFAVFVYKLPLTAGRFLFLLEVAVFAGDLLAARPPSEALVRRAGTASA